MRGQYAVKYDLNEEDARVASNFEFQNFKQVITILNLINDKYVAKQEAD